MSELYTLWLVTSVVVGAVSAVIARMKGRDPVVWFFIGAALNIIALAAVLLVSNYREKRKEKSNG